MFLDIKAFDKVKDIAIQMRSVAFIFTVIVFVAYLYPFSFFQ